MWLLEINGRITSHGNGPMDSVQVGKAVFDNSKKKLRSHKKKESESEAARDDDFFVIEEITEVKIEKEKKSYLVKWVGYPPSQSTWEPEEHIPAFIKKYYENQDNIGKKLPAPQGSCKKKLFF